MAEALYVRRYWTTDAHTRFQYDWLQTNCCSGAMIKSEMATGTHRGTQVPPTRIHDILTVATIHHLFIFEHLSQKNKCCFYHLPVCDFVIPIRHFVFIIIYRIDRNNFTYSFNSVSIISRCCCWLQANGHQLRFVETTWKMILFELVFIQLSCMVYSYAK